MAAVRVPRLFEGDSATQRPRRSAEPAALRRADTPRSLPDEVVVKRSDPVYNAHAYLTKVPYSAIVPFVEALTEPGDVVLDVFAGSGMTGVACAISGRHAELRDISVLGCHIGSNYLRLVDGAAVKAAGSAVIATAQRRLGDLYAVRCSGCAGVGVLSKTVWSFGYACRGCGATVNYYDAYKAAGWSKSAMKCPSCDTGFQTRGASRVEEIPVLDHVRCGCSATIREQPYTQSLVPASLDGVDYPDIEIGADRQMFQASALGKHGLLSTAAFFSDRNLSVLTALRDSIDDVQDDGVREKLLFALTASLTRASKRYQWHPRRPLNAANQNYYIAPVFYEWNVYELFMRKVVASVRSDDTIRMEMERRGVWDRPRICYRTSSADTVDLPDGSIDYVFTDPPFGSQIFYSDMNLFQEAWLGEFTDDEREAVVDRTRKGMAHRSAERYEQLITDSLGECARVLKDSGRLSLVFSNSRGEMWTLVQRAIHAAGFALEHVALLDKGQRSVKGLASGFESVVTSDLILTLRKRSAKDRVAFLEDPPTGALSKAIDSALEWGGRLTPTRVYLSIVTTFLRREWKLAGVAMSGVHEALAVRGYDLDPSTGILTLRKAIAA